MEVGSVWGHGSYVAPDWTADWLHREAMFITTTEFNKAAQDDFGSDPRIHLVGASRLLKVIGNLGEEIAAELLASVTEERDRWQTPSCPDCDLQMVLRHSQETGRRYWECANYLKTGCLQRSYC